MQRIPYLICLLYIAMGCSQKTGQSIPEITLSYEEPGICIKLGDLTDQLRTIRLETNDSCLLSDYCTIIPGEKYIIAQTSNEVLQFNSSGKHIRRLTTSGRGPEEFQFIQTQYLDEKNQRYYLVDIPNSLLTFDLTTGQCLKRSTLPLNIYKILGASNDTLLCQPAPRSPGDTCRYALCKLTIQGEITESLPDLLIGDYHLPVLYSHLQPDGQVCLKYGYSDTLYTVSGSRKTPKIIIKGKYTQSGYYVSSEVLNENTKYYITATTPYQPREVPGVIACGATGTYAVFLSDKQTLTSSRIEKVYAEPLETDFPFQEMKWSGDYVFLCLSAFEIKEKIREKEQLSPALLQLDQNIHEEDNPILLIGKFK